MLRCSPPPERRPAPSPSHNQSTLIALARISGIAVDHLPPLEQCSFASHRGVALSLLRTLPDTVPGVNSMTLAPRGTLSLALHEFAKPAGVQVRGRCAAAESGTAKRNSPSAARLLHDTGLPALTRHTGPSKQHRTLARSPHKALNSTLCLKSLY